MTNIGNKKKFCKRVYEHFALKVLQRGFKKVEMIKIVIR